MVALPKDMLKETITAAPAAPWKSIEAAPGQEEIDQLEAMLREAKAPFLVLGGSRWTEEAYEAIRRFADAWDLPVATGYRRLPLFHPLHPAYAGISASAPARSSSPASRRPTS